MKMLRTRQEIINFVDSLTPEEAEATLQMLNSYPEIMKLLKTKGVLIKIGEKPKKPHHDDDQLPEQKHHRRKAKKTKTKKTVRLRVFTREEFMRL